METRGTQVKIMGTKGKTRIKQRKKQVEIIENKGKISGKEVAIREKTNETRNTRIF